MAIIVLDKWDEDALEDAYIECNMHLHATAIDDYHYELHELALKPEIAKKLRRRIGLPALVIGGWNLILALEAFGEEWFIEDGVNWLEVDYGDEVYEKYEDEGYEDFMTFI